MKTVLSRCSNGRLSATTSMKGEYQWIASHTPPKRRRALISNLFSGKSITRNAAAIPKQVLLSTVTAFIAVPAKFSSRKQLKINGRRYRPPAKPSTVKISYANRARQNGRDHDFLQIVTAASPVVPSKVFRLLPFLSCCTPL